jgi:hypothetical protein
LRDPYLDSRARRWTVQLVAKEKVPRASLQVARTAGIVTRNAAA